ncbi:MAG TPA: DUF58 domain-containing protein [Gaiellales bacterium]|nr:DUF58 domain-containing protein [Gaiellales bacterium]
MTRRPTPWLRLYALAAAALMIAAVATRRPEPAALAAPFLLSAVLAGTRAEAPQAAVRIVVEPLRTVERGHAVATVTVAVQPASRWLEVDLAVNPGLVVRPPARRVVASSGGEPVTFEFEVACGRFGGYTVGPVDLVARDRFGMFAWHGSLGDPVPLRVYPRGDGLRTVPAPRRTAVSVGSTVARAKSAGIEFADIRRFVPGDRARDVNWRVSARRRELHVNEHHPERNSDVVVFLDSFGDAPGWDGPPVDAGVAAAAELCQAYLGRRDRVGLVGFGGVLRWVLPDSGRAQLQRLLDTLIDTRVATSFAWRDLEVIPARTLPPRSLVVAVTPLLDPRTTAALGDLRGRGFDLVVVDVGPERFVAAPAGRLPALAERMWRMQREQARAELVDRGVALAVWREHTSLAAVMAELSEVRRWARTATR